MARYSIELVRGLAVTNNTHEYTALLDPGPLPDRLKTLLEAADVSIAKVGFGPPIGSHRERRASAVVSRLEAHSLSRQIRQLKVDLVHFLQQPPPYLAAQLPLVATLYDMYDSTRDSSELDWLERLRKRQLSRYRSMSAVVCISEASRAAAISLLGLEPYRCVVIPPMLNTALITGNRRQRSPASVHASTRQRYILHVGVAHKRKNPRALIEALSLLDGAYRDVQLWCAGPYQVNPAARTELEDLARQFGVFGRLRMVGNVPDEELRMLYADALCLVFPSLDEGFGYPALEALALGAPSVLADIPAHREAAGPFATYVDPRDHGALARAVAEVADNWESRRMFVKGPSANAWLSKFEAAAVAGTLVATYESSLHRAPAPT